MRKANKALRLAILLLLVAALTAAVCAEDDVVSTTIDEIPPTGRPEVLDREGLMADTLTITVGYFGGEQYTKYVFTAEELQNMADVQQIYTIIDNMPAVCMDAAVGVRLADILKTAGIDLNSIQLLNFYCVDVANTWYTSYSKTALLDTPRYYYPLLPVSWNYDEGQALLGATAGAIQVDAILAVRDKWRRMATTIDFSELTDTTRYRILFGQTDVVTIEGSRSAKWVHTIAVTLGGTPPKGVSLNEEMLRGTAGSSFQLEADVERTDETSDIRVSWSSNEKALNHSFDEPKQWEIREINEIMNNSIEGWTAFSNPRIFAKYGRQRGWERAASGNEQAATGSDLPNGFRELTEEEAQQIEIPF